MIDVLRYGTDHDDYSESLQCDPDGVTPFIKVKCVFPTVVGAILPHTEFGRNDHREDASHFIFKCKLTIPFAVNIGAWGGT